MRGAVIGRIYVKDEGGGGAYYIEDGDLCHAPQLLNGHYDWNCGGWIDPADLAQDDPGWDFARWAKRALLAGMAPRPGCEGPTCEGSGHEFRDGHSFCVCGADRWDYSACDPRPQQEARALEMSA